MRGLTPFDLKMDGHCDGIALTAYPVSVMLTFTLIWRHPDGVAHGSYSAPSFAEAVHLWESETNDCELIGVFAGDIKPVFWRDM